MTALAQAPAQGDLPVDLPPDDQVEQRPPGTVLTCLSALLATAAFGWLGGTVFDGAFARVVGLLGALLGVATVALSMRTRRPSLVQYAGAAAAVVVGALLVLPDATGGSASLPSLVVEAVRGGGLGVPPVPFDPGWRFLLLVLTALLGEASAGLALALRRPRLAAGVALPLVVGAALLQPPGSEVSGTLVALLLLVGSLVVAMGADVADEGTGAAFELRRLARGAGALALLGALLAGTAQLGFLFPEASREQVVPPMRPQLPPPAPDRVLFTVDSPLPVTWRLGTIDVYRAPAWLTPPFDTGRLLPVTGGKVPLGSPQDSAGPLTGRTFTATFTLQDTEGKTLPAVANELAVQGGPELLYDPRTQSLRVKGTRPRRGTTYRVTGLVPPTGRELSRARPPGPAQQPFLEAPPPPPEVSALLAGAPQNPFARLQYVRRAYFSKVVAAGAGKPVDVPPSRVVELLQGRPGTPYEITAGEALLARWAGVPARIGYGYFGGKRSGSGGTVEVRPRNGATWLEAHFTGRGWVPIVGTPPRAQVSLNRDPQNADPSVRASDELALVTYVPIQQTTVRLLYVTVRYYVLAALPWLLAGGLGLALFPALVKLARRLARSRRATALGRQARIAAAYAELRDTATDLGIGNPAMSPVEFLDVVAPDAEHRELAWLVTRALWGDLTRDLQDSDVHAAESMSRSVAKRLRTAQPGFTRAGALTSLASLANPWTPELPRLWPRRGEPVRRGPLAVALVALVVGGVVAGVVAGGAAAGLGSGEAPLPTGSPLPPRIAPAALGGLRFVPERAAERAYLTGSERSLAVTGRVFSIRQGPVVQGSLQVAGLKPEVDVRNRRTRDQVLTGLGSGRFTPTRFGEERGYVLRLQEQTLYLAFARDGRSFSLMVTRAAFKDADRVFAAVLAYRRGQEAAIDTVTVPVPDPRRGSPT